MPSKMKVFFYFFILGFLFFTFPDMVIANTKNEIPSLKVLGSEDWVRTKMEKYPELTWLLDTNVQQTQEGKSEPFQYSWSQKITGQHYPEFERTILSMLCLYLITDGSEEAYQRLTELQPSDNKLTRNSFQRLHEFADHVLQQAPNQLQAVEINLLLGDLGKTQTARQKAEGFGISEPDHDRFLAACLKECASIFPTFQNLKPEIQSELTKGAGLIHFGHMTHVEGGPGMLTQLKRSDKLENDPSGFDLEILTQICDVSAARAHEDNRGSKVLTENTYRALETVKDALRNLSTQSEEETLKYYLAARAEWLGLDRNDEAQQFILARLGAMMRLFSKEEGKALQAGYESISKEQKELLKSELNPLISRDEKTPTYVPAVFVNLLNTYSKQGLGKDKAIQRCLQEGVTFIANVLHQYRNGKANRPYDPTLTLNFNKVAGQVRDHPNLLKDPRFSIDKDGHVEIVATF